MNTNNSQIGDTPLELFSRNNENKSNLDQLLSVEIVTTSQSLIQFTTTNMIPSQIPLIPQVSEHENLSTRQRGPRRPPQRRRQRTREHREEQRRQQQPPRQRQQHHRQRPRQLPNQHRQQPEQQARSQQFRE